MNVLIIDPVQQQERLARVDESLQHYVEESEQARIDNFLDSILSLKDRFSSTAKCARVVEQDLRALFDLSDVTGERLERIDALLTKIDAECERMRGIYIRGRQFFDKHKLAKAPIREYGEATNDLKEVVGDLRLRFFTLPQDQEFQDLMRELSEIA
jgi:hypothetical protein